MWGRGIYSDFEYQAASWDKPRRVVAKVEWHPGELFPRAAGSYVTASVEPTSATKIFAQFKRQIPVPRHHLQKWLDRDPEELQTARQGILLGNIGLDEMIGTKMKPLRMALINPKFAPSFWGMDYVPPILSNERKYSIVTGALPTLAALVKTPHQIEVMDENIDSLNFETIAGFDIVGVTGMIVQRARIFEILEQLKALPCTVIVGGAYASVAPQEFIGHCDALFEGEADTTFPEYLERYATGLPTLSHYKQDIPTDMTKVPTPRYDVLKKGGYFNASIQFSRGCPFRCEFCDIITIFGRRPRLKTPSQMLIELDEVRENGFKTCFLVDDNFIANKAKAKELLVEIVKWQERNGYPLTLITEASLDVADEPELLALMVKANFTSVFIGLESPREDSLKETLKLQNLRPGTTEEKIQRVRDSGLMVEAGFIVGFDSDDDKIFKDQLEFISKLRIAKAAVAILTPIPTTPLYDRLLREGRLGTIGPALHFTPKQMEAQTLIEGHRDLLKALYSPAAYFTRYLDSVATSKGFRQARAEMLRKSGQGSSPEVELAASVRARLYYKRLRKEILKASDGPGVLAEYKRQWHKNKGLPTETRLSFPAFVNACLGHWHLYRISNESVTDYIGSPLPSLSDISA